MVRKYTLHFFLLLLFLLFLLLHSVNMKAIDIISINKVKGAETEAFEAVILLIGASLISVIDVIPIEDGWIIDKGHIGKRIYFKEKSKKTLKKLAIEIYTPDFRKRIGEILGGEDKVDKFASFAALFK